MEPTVLVITNREDGTADRVVYELTERGVQVMRLDAADFPQRLRLAADCDGRAWRGRLCDDLRSVRLEEVAGAYFRHPGQFDLGQGMSSAERRWAYTEARMGFGGVVQALDCTWINHPGRVAAAEYKPVQLAAAARSGLRLPRSWIGNDAEQAIAWAARIGAPIVYKPLGGAVYIEGDTTRIVYTTPVDDVASLKDPAFRLTAHLLQERIDKATEARVTVVGQTMFPVEIRAGSKQGRLDWRADYASHTYRVIDMPEQVRTALRACMDQLGLVYSAADFAITPEGEWIFLGDLNPNGEWGWLAHHCDLPIAAAIADELQKGHP